ncbi:conjugal transfer protein TraB [Streptomyces sp. NBC_00271]|uniref:conjugal transfer protein TraB n=1 Tax=Streptomyces sp. NBC_00271 TaxID=2975697 RepID=UPI002E2BC4D2|nr:conjugal transfer protein TraB [Streptomyces sp. NBC_00271]
MGEIEPAGSKTLTPAAGGEARYTALQRKLKGFAEDMDQAKVLLDLLATRVGQNATRAGSVSRRAAETEFDRKPVELAMAVATALGGVATDGARLVEKAGEVAAKAHRTQVTHQKRYERLHTVRQRRERTPKPGAFVRNN